MKHKVRCLAKPRKTGEIFIQSVQKAEGEGWRIAKREKGSDGDVKSRWKQELVLVEGGKKNKTDGPE